ncbi:coiled-coil domain-containing protein 149 [Zerene cesonia]|uniref:coiled-coil domain-containing protein 149 n=1 Tax=Zerene cesonia TaxID=33412 RepID=UPI0018E50686|nr:coiled-coil domain-containing protein 149 [Zerene cesonia]XP_038213952.1 coiled-coil domain-containing protein 149 [Zerene cesonia]
MFVNKIVKVKFPDQDLDDYVLENSVLKSKLQSKIDALSIMSKELDKCCMERDKYKILVEQLKSKKDVMHDLDMPDRYAPTNTISGGEILAKIKEHNNILKLEVETLRSKLDEATGDIVAMRKQLQKNMLPEVTSTHNKTSCEETYSILDYEQLVQELEKIQKKYKQIQMDYRATLDEKEELVSDRDYYKTKVQRLNQQISFLLTNRIKKSSDGDDNSPKPIVDIDALVMENKYLNERIAQLQVEKEIAKRTLTKYKSLLDGRSKNDTLNFRKGFADVMTQKQVREYLTINSKPGLKRSSVTELKSLCLGLFEALNDKSIALQHQRKTNQILANRISELEKTMESWCNGQKCIPIFPSQILMDEFFNDSVSIKSEESREKPEKEQNNINKGNYSDSEDSNSAKDAIRDNSSSERSISKIILPEELELLVKEALAEMKSAD